MDGRQNPARRRGLANSLSDMLTRRLIFAAPLVAFALPVRGDVTFDIVNLVNAYRRRRGLMPVVAEPRLTRAAQSLADAMIEAGTMSHTADGRTLSERVLRFRYTYGRVSENIVWITSRSGGNLAARMVDLWLGSPPHLANIVDANVTQTGVGLAARGSDYAAAQIFGRPG